MLRDSAPSNCERILLVSDHMARPLRSYIPGVSLHVINRGINRSPLFLEDFDYEWFLGLVERATVRNGVAVHTYALMTNHFHLILTPSGTTALPRAMKEIAQRYAQFYNRKYDRIGTLWNGRYRAIQILDETYWLTCLRYIEQNPVRARMVADPGDYRWSTYALHASGKPPGWIVLHGAYLALGDNPARRQESYRALCGTSVSNAEIVRLRVPGVGIGSDPNPTPV